MTYATTPLIGINPTDANSNPQQVVGVLVDATDDQTFQYVFAGEALTLGQSVHIGLSGTAAALTPALAITAGDIGFVQTPLASGQYGWVARKGRNISVKVAAATADAVALWTTDTAGVLSDTANTLSQFQVMGVITATSNGGSAAAVTAVAQSFPIIRRGASGL